jgi:hypothetical protein
MKSTFYLFATVAILPVCAQVTAPPSTVSVPSAPVTAPTGPNPLSQPGALVNPAVPTATPPQSVGRTFQIPFVGGPPAPAPVINPATEINPGIPPVVVPGTSSLGPTNVNARSPFGTVPGPVGPNIAVPFTNTPPPPFFSPGPEVVVELPPGAVVGTSRTPAPNAVGTPLTPGPDRPFPNTVGGFGNPPAGQRGTADSRPPAVVRPQR